MNHLEIAHWILERNLHWIGAAELKTGLIVTLDVAALGALAAAFGANAGAPHTTSEIGWCLAAAGALGASLFCSGMSIFPKVTGPEESFIFFGKIVKRSIPDFSAAFQNTTETQLLEDCLAQIHRNAEIAGHKFRWVRSSMAWSFLAMIPWFVALASLID